jgi:hypothetical protein
MTAAAELAAFAMSPDPFRNAPDNLAELQLEAMRERFAERRQQIRTLDRRARETGIDEIRTFGDMVPLLFAHTNYKSYPEAFIDNCQWHHMNAWLHTLATYPTDDIDVAGVADVDDWIARAHAAGHHLFASSGTSGKSSFLDQTARDRDLSATACLRAFDFSLNGRTPDHSRVVFTQMPSKGTHKMTALAKTYFEGWARPGELHRMLDEPLRAMDSMRPAQLRRLLAAGKVRPAEIAAYEAEVAQKQARNADAFEQWIQIFYEKRHEPLLIGLMWGGAWGVVERLRAMGAKPGDIHPDTIMSLGGGIKGAKLPPDYREQILGFFGVTPDRITASYAMVEMSGFCAKVQPTESYAVPPWIVPLVLDKAGETLLNPADGKGEVEGRMAFFDILAEARWGGMISGDKVRVAFGSGVEGVKVPVVREINRYQDLEEGEDKLSCAGSIDAYVRGSLAA